MAHTKSQGAVKGNRDSISKRLGIKLYEGQDTHSGMIIVRQKGTKFHSGQGTDIGKDYTIFAVKTGKVMFKKLRGKQYVEVI